MARAAWGAALMVGWLLAGAPAGALGELPEARVGGAGGVHAGNLAWVCQRALGPCATVVVLALPNCYQVPFTPAATVSAAGGRLGVHVGPGTLYAVTEFVLGLGDGGQRTEGGTLVGMYCRYDLPHEVVVYGEGLFLED